ncbi:MAG: DUF1553 domain-containing protein, partial [Verrucomicrobiota bacterium]|nr:DUF1553 domain-containing protein [Verrucomicrobiota bacterium]
HDLHGLPPTPEAVDTFLAEKSPKAYDKLVDQLLNHPRFGERIAQHWLDLAHYADTHGFERDKRRPNAWRYRDYVIKSFNEDKPYLRFLKEQIAGDVIWPDDEDANVGIGFLAAGPWDFVGQVETKSPVLRRSARALDLDDMATQVFTSTQAVTLNCARCHDHKLDPISQEEYFRVSAVFAGNKRDDRTISEAGLKAYEKEKQRLTKELDDAQFELAQSLGDGLGLADIVGGGNGTGNGTKGHGMDPRSAKVQTRNFGALGNVVTNKFYPSPFDFVDGVFIADGKGGSAKIPVSSTGLTVTGLPKTSGKAWDMIRNGPVASQHSTKLGGIDFKDGNQSLLGIHANAGITFSLDAFRKALGQADLRFTAQVGYFGAGGNHRASAWVVVDGKIEESFKKITRADGLQTIDLAISTDSQFLTLISTDGENGYSMDQVGFGNPMISPASPKEAKPEEVARIVELRDSIRKLRKQLEDLGTPPKVYGVVKNKTMETIRIQERGDPDSPVGDPLAPGALSALQMLNPNLTDITAPETDRRLALANWITHEDNPLTYRVIANRLWQWTFGNGLVSTPSDFGFGGDRPSHPELLDWLATRLKQNNGSLKALIREIVLSKIYRQQSIFSDQNPGVGKDTANRLLWRQNPRRMDAETIRDSVLLVSGKLNDQRGGPGFEDFAYKEAYAPEYNYVTADSPKLWRRSIYRFVVRTTPNRFMTTLDCPDPANFTPKRLNTTTPLQSLALYNIDFMLRQAGYLADRIETAAGPNLKKQINQ